ncbi:hypothetical protein [Amycolatopsis sp. lyj-23]|uniref:hypothetical protein n=1 Tax=Amycolatopsis sp. lyj-23 TaxID=2789283 RepID=UPI00397D3DB3
MTRAQGRSRRVKVTVEAIIDITDENALEQAAIADIEGLFRDRCFRPDTPG